MVEHAERKEESLLEKISDKIHFDRSSSSTDCVYEGKPTAALVKARIRRLFGREKSVHHVLAADVFLWRNKKIFASVLGVAIGIWILLEILKYYMVGLVCHLLIFTLAVLFLWSNATTLIIKNHNWERPEEVPCCRLLS